MLTQAQIEQYQEDGYVVPDWRLPPDQLFAMRHAAEAMLAANPEYADLHPALLEDGPQWVEFGCYEPLLTMVRQLMGDDLILWSSGYFGKPAKVGKATPWHQDGGYWPIRPVATCTAWVALDDSTPGNGCLRLIRGSHKRREVLDHDRDDSPDLTLNQALPRTAYDESRAVNVTLEAGQVSFHDVYMVHGSAANTSPVRRRGITYRFMPTTSHFDRELASRQHRELGVVDHTYRTLHLVSGRDVCGKNELTRSPETEVA